MTDHELPDDTYAEIQRLCKEGDELAKNGNGAAGLQKYRAALTLVPRPVTNWDAATWILTAIGDVNFLSGDFSAGRDTLSAAMHCPGAIGNPFIHLRLGQCQYELGDTPRAADELARAYMGAGHWIFTEDDPKYWAFLKTQLKAPPGGWEDEQDVRKAEPKKPWWKAW
jgi:hypothetical protein